MMIEHSESAFYYPDKINFRRIENSQSYIPNELVHNRTKETARKKLKLSSTSATNSKAQQRKQSVTLG